MTVFTSKISQLIRQSNELYSQVGIANQLVQSVNRALVKKSDALLVAQAAPVARLRRRARACSTPPASSTAAPSETDGLVGLVAELQANGSTPTHIVVDPLRGPACGS